MIEAKVVLILGCMGLIQKEEIYTIVMIMMIHGLVRNF